jgi:hypothetical protein
MATMNENFTFGISSNTLNAPCALPAGVLFAIIQSNWYASWDLLLTWKWSKYLVDKSKWLEQNRTSRELLMKDLGPKRAFLKN